MVLAGSAGFSGAAILCIEAALRSGSGLVTLGIPKSLNSAIIKIKPKEAMTLPLAETKDGALSLNSYKKIKDFSKKADLLIIGPGLTQAKSTQALIRKVVKTIKKPMVIDADGLNALSGHLDLLQTADSGQQTAKVLTPHPGEMARLLGWRVKKIQGQRTKIAKKFARDFNVTLVLKGHNTVVADNKGDLYINKTGNPGMSTAGCGDVLTGIIGAFLAQGLSAFQAAKYAVYLHGLAGDLAAQEKTEISLIASDIIGKIPQAIKRANYRRRSSVGRAAVL